MWDGSNGVSQRDSAQPVPNLCCMEELSVSWGAYLGQFLAVYSELGSTAIEMRTAPAPNGPWSEPFTIERAPGSLLMSAWAREQPELSLGGGRRLIISYSQSLKPGSFGIGTFLAEVTQTKSP